MLRKLKIIVSIFVIVFALSFIGCKCNKNDSNYDLIETGIATSVNSFKSAVIELTLTSEDIVLYKKTMNINKETSGSSYIANVKELSQDLYAPSLYNESESRGNLTDKETLNLFPLSDQFKEENTNDLVRNENQVDFMVNKENIMSVFNLETEDVNKISNEGIKVTITFDGDKVKEYSYVYKTNNGINVIVVGSFVF